MLKAKLYTALIISLFTLLDCACPQLTFAQQKNKRDKEQPLSALNGNEGRVGQQAEYLYTEGLKQFILEDYKKALTAFRESAELVQENAAVHYKLSQVYLLLEEPEEALEAIDKALLIDGGNEHFFLMKAGIFRQQRQYAKAAAVYEKLTSLFPGDLRYFFELADSYLEISDYRSALNTFNKAENLFGVSELITRRKQQILIGMEEIDAALKEGEKLMNAFPNNQEYVVTHVLMLLGQQQVDKALKLLEDLQRKESENPQVKLILGRIYLYTGRHTEAYGLIESAFIAEDLSEEAKAETLELFLAMARKGDDPAGKGMELAKLAMEMHPESPSINVLYGNFLLLGQDLKESRDTFLEALQANGDSYELWLKVIDLDWKLKDYEALVKHADLALEMFPNQAELYLFQGAAYTMLKAFDDAQDVLEMGKMYALTDELRMQFALQLADIYHHLKDYVQSDAAFEAVLGKDPTNLQALNNYSYFLALRKEKMDRALVLSQELVALAPDQPNFLDTRGWVLYSAGKYKEAKKYLEKAASLGESADITEHYGDVLFKLGEKEAALNQWMKAKGFGNSSDPERLNAKIEQGKLIE